MGLRPVDLAREAGISAQLVRNYEAEGILPAAHRSASGYRQYELVQMGDRVPAIDESKLL